MSRLRKLCWEISTYESSAELSALSMTIGHSSQADTKGDTHVFDHEVGILLFGIFWEPSILELGDATCGKIFTWHTFLRCH